MAVHRGLVSAATVAALLDGDDAAALLDGGNGGDEAAALLDGGEAAALLVRPMRIRPRLRPRVWRGGRRLLADWDAGRGTPAHTMERDPGRHDVQLAPRRECRAAIDRLVRELAPAWPAGQRMRMRGCNLQRVLPGSPDQAWHRDAAAQGRGYVTILCALGDQDRRTGGTEFRDAGAAATPLRRGDCVVFDGGVEHRGLGNRGDVARWFAYVVVSTRACPNLEAQRSW